MRNYFILIILLAVIFITFVESKSTVSHTGDYCTAKCIPKYLQE